MRESKWLVASPRDSRAAFFKRLPVPLSVLGIPLLLASLAVVADVNFPANPQTMGDCELPASQMRAMEESERDLADKARKEYDAAPFESLYSARPIHEAIMEVRKKHFNEYLRIAKEREALEKACRVVAAENEQLAKEARQRDSKSLLDNKAFQDLKEGYEKAKDAYEKAKDIYEKSQTPPAELVAGALNEAKDRIASSALAEAYARRNNAYSEALESALNNAKKYLLDLVPKSRIVASFQTASFNELKSQVQQLNGDVNALESSIRSIGTAASGVAGSPDRGLPDRGATPVPADRDKIEREAREQERMAALAEVEARIQFNIATANAEQDNRDKSGTAMFNVAIAKAELDNRDKIEHGAREQERLAALAEAEARIQLNVAIANAELDDRGKIKRERAQPAPDPSAPARSPSTGGAQICENERQRWLTEGGTGKESFDDVREFIRIELGSRYIELQTMCNVSPRCRSLPTDSNFKFRETSPHYGDALIAVAEVKEYLRGQRPAVVGAGNLYVACVARHMASQIKGTNSSR